MCLEDAEAADAIDPIVPLTFDHLTYDAKLGLGGVWIAVSPSPSKA